MKDSMEELLSKEHYCYKIDILLMKSNAYTPSIDNPLYGLPPIFTWKYLSSVYDDLLDSDNFRVYTVAFG